MPLVFHSPGKGRKLPSDIPPRSHRPSTPRLFSSTIPPIMKHLFSPSPIPALTFHFSLFIFLCFAPMGCSPSPAPEAPPAVTLVDALDRTVALPALPRRPLIAGKAPYAIENALLLFPEARANPDLLLPGGRAAQRPGVPRFANLLLPSLPPAAPEISQGNVEQIAARRPDVVLLKTNSRLFGESIDPLGVPVVYLSLETPADYPADLARLGALLGAPDSARTIADFYQSRLDAVSAALATLPPDAAPPSVLVLQATSADGAQSFRVPPPDWIQTRLVELAGGHPVWTNDLSATRWSTVSLEQIAAWNPDLVLLVSYTASGADALSAIAAHPVASAIPALSPARVRVFPADFVTWDQPDPRWILGLLWTARQLHPELFPTPFRAEIDAFYALYSLTPDDVASLVLPHLDAPTGL